MITFILLLLLLFGVPALSLFIKKCMESGMIFHRYYLYLVLLWIRNRKKKNRYKRNILKPLGLCVYCYNTWLSIFFYLLFLSNVLMLPIFIGLTYIILEVFLKVISKWLGLSAGKIVILQPLPPQLFFIVFSMFFLYIFYNI